jgi:hypothetical protein
MKTSYYDAFRDQRIISHGNVFVAVREFVFVVSCVLGVGYVNELVAGFILQAHFQDVLAFFAFLL